MSFVSLTETAQSLRWLRARWSSLFFVGAPAAELGFYRLLFYGFILYSLGSEIDVRRWAGVSDAFWSPTSFFRVFHLPVLSAASLIAIVWVWRLPADVNRLHRTLEYPLDTTQNRRSSGIVAPGPQRA